MLERLLRSKALANVLGIVLFCDGLHLREIARRAEVSSFQTKRELDILVELGVLKAEKKGNQIFFQTNNDCPYLIELKNLYSKTEGLFHALQSTFQNIDDAEYVFIFGSAASGKEKQSSDIDLMVIGDIDHDQISRSIFKIQKTYNREINFIFWTKKDLKEKISKHSSFLKNIARNKRIFIKGDEDEFVRFIEKGFSKKG
jgi:predicted nucleotidyltransferase